VWLGTGAIGAPDNEMRETRKEDHVAHIVKARILNCLLRDEQKEIK
jgi:hypothetical protein